jgi:membrane protease YdiL (CAAX protease family)
VVNNSTSKPSAHWPTTWPSDSFRAGPTALLLLAIVVASLVILGAGILLLGPEIARRGGIPVTGAIALQFVLEVVVVMMILVALPRISGFTLAQLGFKALRPRDVLYGVGGAVAMLIVVQGSSSLAETLSHQHHEQQVVELFKQLRAPAAIWLFGIFAAVIAPIAEETIFRIFLFNAVMRYGGFWTGAIVSGLCFGAVHGDAFAFLPLALGGVLLCYVYYRSGNAFASMISHGLFNAVTLIALLFAPPLAH